MKKVISLIIALSLIFSLFSFSGVSAAEEVLIDDSFEEGISSKWTLNEYDGATLTVDTTTAADGSKSLYFDDSSSTKTPAITSQKFDAAEGDVFEVSAYFKMVEGSNLFVFYKCDDSTGKNQTVKSYISSSAKEWTYKSVTVEVPAGSKNFYVQVVGYNSSVAKGYVDKLKVVKITKDKPATSEKTEIVNTSFENSIPEGWYYKDNYSKEKITFDSTTAADGQVSLLFDDDSTTVAPILYSDKMPVKAGDTFDVSASFKHVEGYVFSVYCKFADSDGKEMKDYKTAINSTATEWTEKQTTVVAPEGAAYFFLQITGALATVGKTYIDNVKVIRTTSIEPEVPQEPETPEEPEDSEEGKVVFKEDFEGDLSQWKFYNEYAETHAVQTDKEAHSGSKSFSVLDDSADSSPNVKSVLIPGEPGDKFKVSAYFKHETGSIIKIWTRFYNANGKNETADSSFGSNKNEWTLVEYTATIPEGFANLQLLITGAKTYTGLSYIDDITVVKLPKEPEPPEGNVIFYDYFETDLSKWTLYNDLAKTDVKISKEEAHTGSRSLFVEDTSTTATPILKTPMYNCEPGDGFKISAYTKHVADSAAKVWVKYYDENGKNQVNGESFGTNKTEWTYSEVTAFVPEGSKKIQIWIAAGVGTLGKTYIDDLAVIKLSKEEAEAARPVTLPAPKPIAGIPTAEEENFHIYLCIGQSNMVGADAIQKPDMVVVDGAYLYNKEGNWELAQPYPISGTEYMGYNRYSSVSASGRTGPTIGFARGMALKVPKEVKVGIISNAIGGTTVQQWSKGFGEYEDLPVTDEKHYDRDLFELTVKRTKEALEKGGVLKGIFYLQGETCAAKETEYLYRLKNIANDLRDEFGLTTEELPFFVSEIPQIRPAGVATIRKAPQHIENCYVISSEGLTIFDSIHFDADSQRKLGLRFAETALRVQYDITASADDMYKEIYGNSVEAPKADVEYKVVVNGQRLVTDVPAIEAGGRIFVPVRAIFEALGATVSWDEETETVTGVRGDRTVVMQVGDEHMTVNGVSTGMLIAPMIRDMRTLVPIRFVGEGLGATVDWNEETFTATIELR